MSGFRKTLFAAVLACCTHAVATEPVSPPPLGSLLRNGWGVPSELERSAAVKEKGAAVPASPDAAPVEPDVVPVVKGPLVQDPVVQVGKTITSPAPKITSPVPKAGQKDPAATFQANGRSQNTDFETLQIDRAPSVPRLQPRLQPRRSLIQGRGRENLSVDDQARVIAAAPINEMDLPVMALPELSQAKVPQSAEICDLVDVAMPRSSSTLLSERQPLPVAPAWPVRPADSDAADQAPDFDEVASLFQELRSTHDENVIVLLKLPPGAEDETSEDVVLLAKGKNLDHAVPVESPNTITGSWGLIESTNVEAVDPLRRAADLWELTKQSLQQARQAALDGEVAALRTLSMESFRLCISALDAAEQTDASAALFQEALDAIRESKDFCLVDEKLDKKTQQIQQIILGHTTDVLKKQERQGLSRHEAAYCYMTYARRSLVKASKGIPEASEALMLLGAAEAISVDGNPSHRNAIAVMLQRAAIEICPADHEPHLALGITLSNQGLGDQSRLSLQRSVEIRPTPRAYQELIELATQAEDKAVLEDLHVKLQQLAPDADATVVTLENASDNTRAWQGKVHSAESGTETKPRIGWRAMLPFIR